MNNEEYRKLKETDYIKLLRTIIQVGEANKGLEAGSDDRILDAEGLLLKFFGHASSLLYLSRSTTIQDIFPDIPISFFDPGSINILARAALETFLVFHYIFIAPQSETEKDFRYVSWVYAGLLERQKYPVHSPQGKQKLQSEKQGIDLLKEKLQRNAYFRKLPSKQQDGLLRHGKWRFSSWKDIALSAGLNEATAKGFYNFLCGYAHANYISILQIRQAENANDQKHLFAAAINLVMIAMANMIRSYCNLFPKSKNAIQEKDAAQIVENWVFVGQKSAEDIEIDWSKVDL